jgi:hypothetical protein
MSGKEICYPLEPTIEMTLTEQPIHNNFTRYLSFQNYQGRTKRLAVAFRKRSGLTWHADSFPDGIDTLRSLADTDNRSYWDTMLLQNRGGSTEIRIGHLLIVMHYEDTAPGCQRDIPIVDTDINRTLAAGTSSTGLDPYARVSRYTWAGLDFSEHPVALQAARDLGKSGSDGQDQYGANPKYGADVSLLCSEFVSWYYHESGLVVGDRNFRDIVGTGELHSIFESAGQLYRYHSGSKRAFIHSVTEDVYQPRAGDFLERRAGGKAEHSMIMLRWDDTNKEATVINGPWPVTLRRVRVQYDERNRGKDFWLGRIEPL